MAVDSFTVVRGEGPECAEGGDTNCQSGDFGAREYRRLSWASDFFPASHWTSSASSTPTSGRCNSRDSGARHTNRPGAVIENHATPASVPTNRTPEEAPISSILPRSDNDAHTKLSNDNKKNSKESANSKMISPAACCTAASTSYKGKSQLPYESHPAGFSQASMKVSLVCGPLAVQETLSERQLCIEKRMMELRQQNRRRLQRRQQEAKLQQQQRLREQQAALLARRHRLKLASLWKERGMAAAVRSTSLLKKSNPPRQSQPAASIQKDSSNAEELLTALVLSESIDLQQADAGSDSAQCTTGGPANAPAGYTHVYSRSQGSGAALPSFSLYTSREQPSGEAISSLISQDSREMQALLKRFLHAPSRTTETDATFATPPCPELQRTSLKATNSAGSYLNLCLHQPTQGRTDSQNSDAASRPSPEALPRNKSYPKLQAKSSASSACKRRAASQHQTHGAERALYRDSNQVLRGGDLQYLKTSKTCSLPHQVRHFSLRPEHTQSSLAHLCHYGTEVGSSVTSLLRPANKSQSQETLTQGCSFSIPSRVPAPPTSTDKGEADGQGTRREQPPQAVVVVSDHQLKKELELKLQQQQTVHQGQAVRHQGLTALQAAAAHQEQPAKFKGRSSSSPSQMKVKRLADGEASKTNGETGEISKRKSLNEGSAFLPTQQVGLSQASEQQLQIPIEETRGACREQCRKTVNKQIVREEEFLSDAPEEIVRGKDNQLLSSTQSEAERQEAIPSDGAARAQAAGLQLVRVTRQIWVSLGAKNTHQASLEQGHCCIKNASRPPHGGSCSSRLLWQAARESQPSGISGQGRNSSASVDQPFKSTSSAEQEQGEQEGCSMLSHRANEASDSSRGTPKHQEEKVVTCSSKSSALGCASSEGTRTRQWNPTSLAVQALEEAQQLEEKRLLLLEVSHHAIEKQAKNRRKELALLQWLQHWHNQQNTQEAGDSFFSKKQQLQQQAKIASTHLGLTVEEEAQAAIALSGNSEPIGSHTRRAGLCHQQAQLCQKSTGQQVRQSSRVYSIARPLTVTQCAASFAYSQHLDALQASCSKTESRVDESIRLVRNHSVDKGHSRLVQHQNHDELLQQQQALLQQLLQQRLLDIPSNQSQTKKKESAARDAEAHGSLWGSKVLAPMQRRDVLQALQRLLLRRTKTGSQAAASFEDCHDGRQALIHREQRRQKCQQQVALLCTEAASLAESSAAQKRCASSLPSSSYRLKIPLPSLRLDEAKAKGQRMHQRQQDINGKSLRRSPVQEEITSGRDEHSTRPELTPPLSDKQHILAAAIIGPLLVSLLQNNPSQQKHELGEPQQHVFQQASRPGRKILQQTSSEDARVNRSNF
ncbi:hypothetical protein Esti_001139 [Eimeria stiedai]